MDVTNPSSGEDFVLGLKEITLPDGVTRPYSMWLAGNYPRALDGLCWLTGRQTPTSEKKCFQIAQLGSLLTFPKVNL